jgi:outer membrane protein insertion porin family
MKSSPSHRLLTLLATLLLAFLAACPTARAQTPTVKEIEVQYAGPATVSKERILANMRTTVGKPYSQQVTEEDIRNIYATGVVNNVRIFGEPSRDGVKVIVVVQTKATISEIAVVGATAISEKRIRKEITLKPGDVLNEATLQENRQKIIELYQNKNFPETQVAFKSEADEKAGKARVIFTISESGRSVIGAIHFEGNTVFTEKELRKQMKTKKSNLLSFFTKAGRVQNEQIEKDVQVLREYYQNAGYVDAEVSSPATTTLDNGKTELLFRIKEGAQYKVGSVDVSNAQVFTTDELRTNLKTTEGATFSLQTLRDDAKRIQDLYGARGYVDLQVLAETSSGGNNVVNVAFNLDEGAQSYLEQVNISGNTRTKDKVIRRELALAPGDIYNTVLVDASKQRLGNLNYFEKVETYPTDTLVPGRKDLNIAVQEKRTGSFNFGAGFSSIDNLLGFAEVQQSNFDLMNWPKFTGGGQRFRARIQYGTKRKDFIVSLTEPYFLDYKLAVGGEAFYRDLDFYSSVYSERDAGIDLFARRPAGKFGSLQFNYRLEDIKIYNIDPSASQTIQDEEGSRLKSSITGRYTYDTRDSVFLTRKGERVNFSTFVAGGPLGGDTDVYGFNIEGSKYFLLPWDTILLFNGELGTVDTWAGGDRVPIFDRLFLGGANDLRGFNYRDVGPKDENGEPIGGKTLARLTVEYTFPIVERLRGALFYDIGYVNSGSYEFGPSDVNSDVGIGVRIDLPIGPVRLDYGIPIQSDRWNDSSGRFNFNIGYQF